MPYREKSDSSLHRGRKNCKRLRCHFLFFPIPNHSSQIMFPKNYSSWNTSCCTVRELMHAVKHFLAHAHFLKDFYRLMHFTKPLPPNFQNHDLTLSESTKELTISEEKPYRIRFFPKVNISKTGTLWCLKRHTGLSFGNFLVG